MQHDIFPEAELAKLERFGIKKGVKLQYVRNKRWTNLPVRGQQPHRSAVPSNGPHSCEFKSHGPVVHGSAGSVFRRSPTTNIGITLCQPHELYKGPTIPKPCQCLKPILLHYSKTSLQAQFNGGNNRISVHPTTWIDWSSAFSFLSSRIESHVHMVIHYFFLSEFPSWCNIFSDVMSSWTAGKGTDQFLADE